MNSKVYILILLISRVSTYTHCDCVASSNSECPTLYQYSRNSTLSSTELLFIGQNHSLNTTFVISNITNISFVGVNHTATILCTGENAGFIFQNVEELEIKNLKLMGCGTFYNRTQYRAALVIQNGCNLSLINITILYAKDAGINSYNVGGTTFISNLKIADTNATLLQSRGNQILCLTNGCKLIIQDSEVMNNTANRRNQTNKIVGLTINVTNSSGNITIKRSAFIKNVGTSKGGNLAIILNNVSNIFAQYVHISDSIIDNGSADTGAGLYIFITKTSSTNAPPHSKLDGATIIDNITFTNNVALYHGAAFFIQLKASTQDVKENHSHYNISLVNCTFTNNSLKRNKKGGIAVHSNYFDIDDYLLQIKPQYKMMLKNIIFQNHHTAQNNETSGNSVIFINTNDLFVINNVTVTGNGANAITAVKSNLLLQGNIELSHNRGSSGGGLLLCQNTILYLTPNLTMEIYDNSVSHAGGGIYVEPQCLQEKPPCFFQVVNEIKTDYKNLNNSVSIHVYNNTASYGGHNLFGGDIDYCYLIDSPNLNKSPFTNLQVYNDMFMISNANSSVTSLPRHICFCQNRKTKCQLKNPPQKDLYPGEVFAVEAVLVGQMNGTVPGVVQTWVKEINQTTINLNGKVQNISHECTLLNYTIGTNSSKANSFHIQLAIGVQHTGDQSGYERLRVFHNKHVRVNLKECPIGFVLDSSSGLNNYTCSKCQVGSKSDFECHIEMTDRIAIKRQANAKAWIGFEYSKTDINDSLPVAIRYNKNCPFDYCVTCEIELNMKKGGYNTSLICANNRSGTMCGGCKKHYSAMLGSSKCSRCTNRYVILLIAFAFAGLLLVAALTLLNLTIAEGTLSGLIFYANVIECNSSFIIPHKDYHILPTPILGVFLAWINLDLGIPVCFYDGMDAYAEAWLQFAFPLYIWVIAIAIIVLSNRFQLVAKIAGKNAVKVLATIVLLSYTTFTHAVISTFAYTTIHVFSNNRSTNSQNITTAWLIDPNFTYFELKHLLLFGVALILGLLTLPFALILLFIKPLLRFSHKRMLKWIQSLKPFLDAYTGPYTASGRFWPGLLLFARICLSITGGLNTLSEEKVIQNVTSLIIIILLGTAALVRPGLYRSRSLDALEYFFLFNLSALFLGTTYYYDKKYKQKAIFDVSVGLAFLTFILIVLYHLLLKIRQYRALQCIHAWAKTKLRVTSNHTSTSTTPQNMRYLPPFVSFTEEREPLLADHDE